MNKTRTQQTEIELQNQIANHISYLEFLHAHRATLESLEVKFSFSPTTSTSISSTARTCSESSRPSPESGSNRNPSTATASITPSILPSRGSPSASGTVSPQPRASSKNAPSGSTYPRAAKSVSSAQSSAPN